MDVLAKCVEQLSSYFIERNETVVLKIHGKNLAEIGDLSVKHKTSAPFAIDVENLVAESENWNVPIVKATFEGEFYNIFFHRSTMYQQVITNAPWRRQNSQRTLAFADRFAAGCNTEAMSLTDYREHLLTKVTRNILTYAGYEVVTATSSVSAPCFEVVQRRSRSNVAGRTEIVCGPVLVPDKSLTAESYIAKRSNDMQLMAQHKYGVRIHDRERLQEVVAKLGRSAVVSDMLESKHSSPIDMRRPYSASSCKGAAFILYNYARLAALFRKYEDQLRAGFYPPEPPCSEIDFSLLTEEDEWHLFYTYVVGFPNALQVAIGRDQLDKMAPHSLHSFTMGLVVNLSRYYRRVRILTDNRSTLMPVMFARIKLLRGVYQTLLALIGILELEAVTEM